MRTSIRIERVVLDGLRLSHPERAALAPAIARELRLLAGERADEPSGRRAEPRPAGPGPSLEGIAREVAVAVHRALEPVTVRWALEPAAVALPPAIPAALAAPVVRRGPG
jgi:hypothetical protein